MGLQLFKSPPVPSVHLLCMWVQTRQPLLVSGRSVLISLMCNLLGQQSLWHLFVLWLFLRAGKPGLHCTQDLCVCTYPSIPRITGGTDWQTPLFCVLCWEVSSGIAGTLKHPFLLQLQSPRELQLTVESWARDAFMFHLLHPGICHSDSRCSC